MRINKKNQPAGLYIHIPFCLRKCGYCDFLSFGGCSEELQAKYVDALCKEIGMYAGQKVEVDTVYIGGGTPSLLHQNHIRKIMKAAEAAFCVTEDAEITIEAIKKKIEPQVNHLIENIVKLQQSQNMTENLIPSELVWDYGDNERLDDMKKLEVLQDVQRAMSVPYSVRADIVLPILNKLVDKPIERDSLVKEWQDESNKMNIEFGEL